jgi:hypothetical protein
MEEQLAGFAFGRAQKRASRGIAHPVHVGGFGHPSVSRASHAISGTIPSYRTHAMAPRLAKLLVVLAASWACASAAGAGTLVVNANTADPSPRAAWQAAVRKFEAEHPHIRVELNVYDH